MFDDIYRPIDDLKEKSESKQKQKAVIIDDELDFPIIFEDDVGLDIDCGLDDDLSIDDLVDIIKELSEEIESELEEPWTP